jgi:hypothetical protein
MGKSRDSTTKAAEEIWEEVKGLSVSQVIKGAFLCPQYSGPLSPRCLAILKNRPTTYRGGV